ncbi:hypothetical protein THAOC_05102, partial [Thalassiosira oceanica]
WALRLSVRSSSVKVRLSVRRLSVKDRKTS